MSIAGTLIKLALGCQFLVIGTTKEGETSFVKRQAIGKTIHGDVDLVVYNFNSNVEPQDTLVAFLQVRRDGKSFCAKMESFLGAGSLEGDIRAETINIREIGRSRFGCESETTVTYAFLDDLTLQRKSEKTKSLDEELAKRWRDSIKGSNLKRMASLRIKYKESYSECNKETYTTLSDASFERAVTVSNDLRKRGDPKRAAKNLLDFMRDGSMRGNPQIRNDFAFILEQGGEFEKALGVLAGVLLEAPDRSIAYKNMSDVAMKLGDTELTVVIKAFAFHATGKPLKGEAYQPPLGCTKAENPNIELLAPNSQDPNMKIRYFCRGVDGKNPIKWSRTIKTPVF